MEREGADALATLRTELDLARAAAARDEAVLTQLADTLHWEGAPRSLQMVLPLARLLRRVHGSGNLSGAASPAAPAGQQRGLATRIAMRIFAMTRPVSLPLVRRAYRLLGRLLEREDKLSQRDATTGSAPATAELLRSIEAAMLTLAVQRHGETP